MISVKGHKIAGMEYTFDPCFRHTIPVRTEGEHGGPGVPLRSCPREGVKLKVNFGLPQYRH